MEGGRGEGGGAPSPSRLRPGPEARGARGPRTQTLGSKIYGSWVLEPRVQDGASTAMEPLLPPSLLLLLVPLLLLLLLLLLSPSAGHGPREGHGPLLRPRATSNQEGGRGEGREGRGGEGGEGRCCCCCCSWCCCCCCCSCCSCCAWCCCCCCWGFGARRPPARGHPTGSRRHPAGAPSPPCLPFVSSLLCLLPPSLPPLRLHPHVGAPLARVAAPQGAPPKASVAASAWCLGSIAAHPSQRFSAPY